MTELGAAPGGFVQVLPPVPREQGLVVQGLLDAYGIQAVLVGARFGAYSYTREPSRVVSGRVPEDRVDEANEVLAADPGEGEGEDVPQ